MLAAWLMASGWASGDVVNLLSYGFLEAVFTGFWAC